MEIDQYGVSVAWKDEVSKATVSGYKVPCNFHQEERCIWRKYTKSDPSSHKLPSDNILYLCFYKQNTAKSGEAGPKEAEQ